MKQARLTSYLKIVLFIFIAGLSNILISGCENSSENKTEEQNIDEEDPGEDIEVFEDRIIYAEGLKCYAMNYEGESEYLFDLQSVGGGNSYYKRYSINGAKKKIIYFNKQVNKIYISNFDGSEKAYVYIQVSSAAQSEVYPEWSADGTWALCKAEGKFYKVDITGKNVIQIGSDAEPALAKTETARMSNFTFSSNGKYFAYRSVNGITLFVSDTSGNIIKSYPGYSSSPTITPGGDTVYSVSRGYSSTVTYLRLTDLNTDTHRKITPDSLFVDHFTLSSDGKKIMVAAARANRSYSLYLYDVQNDSLSFFYGNAADNWYPSFSSDGSKVIWQSNQSGISIMNIDGTGIRELKKDAMFLGRTRFKIN